MGQGRLALTVGSGLSSVPGHLVHHRTLAAGVLPERYFRLPAFLQDLVPGLWFDWAELLANDTARRRVDSDHGHISVLNEHLNK